MAQLNQSSLEEALREVIDPVFDKPMLEVGTLRDLRVEGGAAKARVRLVSPSEEVKAKAEAALRGAMEEAFGGAAALSIEWDLSIPSREVMGDDPVPGVRNILLVMSGKGGVGKSTVAVNLTLALKAMGLRVGVLDADIYGPSIPTMMGVSGHPISKDGKKIAPLTRFGVSMMSIGFLLESDKQAVIWRGPMLHGALNQFLRDVDWGELDYLVLDLPPGTGDVALTMAQQLKANGAVIVTTPQEVALADVYKSVSMCAKLKIPILGVIENMSHFVDSAGVKHALFGEGGGQKIADYAQAPLLGQVPIVPAIREWGDKGMPIVQSQPESEPAQVFRAAAEHLAASSAVELFKRGGGEKAPASKGPKRLKILR